jgi:hypothetical protein
LVLRVTLLCSFLALAACASQTRAVVVPSAPPAREEPRVLWPRFSEVQSWPTVGGPFANRGHTGMGSLAVVRVSPEAREAYTHLVQESVLPDGAVVALFHFDAANRASSTYVMQKRAGAWSFLMLDGAGVERANASETGRASEACRRCHADGVADSLFGVPRRSTSTR